MNKEYIDQIKPSGIIRTWLNSPNSNSRTVEHELDLQMNLKDNQNGDLIFPTGQTKIKFDEGEHKNWRHDEIGYAFSKAENAESKLIRTGDSIRYEYYKVACKNKNEKIKTRINVFFIICNFTFLPFTALSYM